MVEIEGAETSLEQKAITLSIPLRFRLMREVLELDAYCCRFSKMTGSHYLPRRVRLGQARRRRSKSKFLRSPNRKIETGRSIVLRMNKARRARCADCGVSPVRA